MKAKVLLVLLALALVLPLSPAGAQGNEAGGGAAAQSSPAGTLADLFNKAIALLSSIGNLFGRVTGIRIGGPAVTGIIALLAAKFVAGRVPSLFKWALIIGGVILLTGSGANILQTIMRYLPG